MSRSWAGGSSRRWRVLRAEVLRRNLASNGGMCVLCQVRTAEVAGHILAKSHGGPDLIGNLRAECLPCSRSGGGVLGRAWHRPPNILTVTNW